MAYKDLVIHFLHDEDGAITVDYVTLTAASLGVGLGASALLGGGLLELAQDFAAEVTGPIIEPVASMGSGDMTARIGAWTNGIFLTLEGFGDVMMLTPQATAETIIDIPEGATEATFTFDVISGDTLDMETSFFYINGELIAHLNSQSRPVYSNEVNIAALGGGGWVPDGFTVQEETVQINANIGGDPYWKDAITRITITMENPPPQVTFGTGTNTNQAMTDEFYAIDNFGVATR